MTREAPYKGGPKVDSRLGRQALQQRADAFAAGVGRIVLGLRQEGRSLRQIAGELASRGIRTPRGGGWTAAAVRSVVLRSQQNAYYTPDSVTTRPAARSPESGMSFGPTLVQGETEL